jgi:molecular chaperone DnaK
MRNKIDYGIDLGTTNSAISRMENGMPTIKKSDTQEDTTPSCVNINKKKDFTTGRIAFNAMKTDNARALKSMENSGLNSYFEFKRTMGTTHSYRSTFLNKNLSSEELSAEVLKKLKSYILDENVNSVVITVPAKFLNPQKEATLKAAQLAGFKNVELLQEPIAAATAYGLGAKNKNGFWVVFDFGGGTFDTALVKAEDGILSVKDTAGDNWLGGKNLDNAVIDEIIIPHLAANFSIDFVLQDELKLQMLRDAVKAYAEEAKNQLSFKDKVSILSAMGDLPFEDKNGEEPEIDLEVTLLDLELVLSPIFQKAIDITKNLIKRNNLKGSDIDALILVGGPTYSPILRKMLKEQITEKVDTTIDPMTAVANGAALFASTLSISEEVKEQNRDKTKLQLEVNYEATSVELDSLLNISILKDKTEGKIPDEVFIEIISNDGSWSSGKKLVGEKKTLMEVILNEGVSNVFVIRAFDGQGNKIECQPNQFNILQGIGGLEGMTVLPYHICIVKHFDDEDKDLIASVKGLEKNNKLPAVGVRNGLKTRNEIRPGMASDIIRIPIYQGDYNAERSNPLLNDLVQEIIITGEHLPKLLPIGSPVDLTIKVNRSEKMKVTVEFPTIEHTEEVEIVIQQKEPPTSEFLKDELHKSIRKAKNLKQEKVEDNLKKLDTQLDNEGGSADGKMQIQDGLRKELLILGEAEKTAEWPELEKELKDTFYEFEDLIDKIKGNGNDEDLKIEKIDAHLQEFRVKVELIVKTKDRKEAKELISEINGLDFELRNMVSGNAMDVQYMKMFHDQFEELSWTDKNRAKHLTNQGIELIMSGRNNAIRPLLVQLVQLLPKGEIPDTLG